MFVRWREDLVVPTNDLKDRPCECGKLIPQEEVEFFAVSDGRRLLVKRVQTHNELTTITLDV